MASRRMIPTIVCFDHATVPLGIDLGKLLRNGKKHVIFGSRATAKRFRKEDRRQHRSEFRGPRGRRAALQRSKP